MQAVRALWQRSSPKLRSVFWLSTAAATLAAMSVVIRYCSTEMHPFTVLFYRNLFSLVLVAGWVYGAGLTMLRTGRAGFYTLRAAVSLVAMLAWFYGVTIVPLSTATALIFTTPLFAVVGSALVLGEVVSLRRWCALSIGFAGVLVIVRPDTDGSLEGAWIMLICAAASGMNIVTVKFLSTTERPTTIVAYLTLLLTPLSLVPALFFWSWPSLAMLPWLVILAVLATLAHLFLTRAYALADAGFLAPFEFSRLIFAVALGYLFFGETAGAGIWAGAAVILLGVFESLRGSHVRAR